MPWDTFTHEQRINYFRRVLGDIENSAKKVDERQRHWTVSHSQLLVFDEKIRDYRVVALRPYAKGQAGYRLLENGNPSDDMRHMAKCDPAAMLMLVAHLREMFPELQKPQPAEKREP